MLQVKDDNGEDEAPADWSQLYVRIFQLESELSVAAALLELREQQAAERGEPRSTIVSELMDEWRKLIANKDLPRVSTDYLLNKAADEIDCCPDCDHVIRDEETGGAECRKSERGEYCPNDVAETLRAAAAVSARDEGETQ